MRTLDKYTLLFDACKRFKYAASQCLSGGQGKPPDSCIWLLEKYPATVIYTRDVGHHTSGWWKNPDYERCWHLSISFRSGTEKKALNEIIQNLFAPNEKWIWIEPPFSETGKSLNVWHYRLFCDEHWQPIKPRGEVYNTEFTERGWKSFSEVQETKYQP